MDQAQLVEEDHEAQRDADVVHEGNRRGDAVAVFVEPDPDVDDDAGKRHDHRQESTLAELTHGPGTDRGVFGECRGEFDRMSKDVLESLEALVCLVNLATL